MINTDIPHTPTDADTKAFITDLENTSSVIMQMDAKATFFLTREASYNARLPIAWIGNFSNIELAISSNQTGEKLSDKIYTEQKAILLKSRDYAELCHYCDVNTIIVKGFMPQSFDQNEDTYKLLDDMGIKYNAGFQSGLIYAPGYEKDTWPYQVDGYEFYAVPVSTYELAGKMVPLQDSLAKENGLKGPEWYEMLQVKFQEASKNDEPMAVLLTTSVSGEGDYLDALKEFLEYAISENARFVTTSELVNMTISGDRNLPAPVPKLPIPTPVVATQINETIDEKGNTSSSGCKTCGSDNNSTSIILLDVPLK